MNLSQSPRPDSYEGRLAALERELKRLREVADAERRRADLAEASMRAAWKLSTWRRPAGLEAK